MYTGAAVGLAESSVIDRLTKEAERSTEKRRRLASILVADPAAEPSYIYSSLRGSWEIPPRSGISRSCEKSRVESLTVG